MKLMFRLIAICTLLLPASPAAIGAAATPTEDSVSSAAFSAAQSKRPKKQRRRKRPIRRSGDYTVVSVPNGGTIEGQVRYPGKVPAPRKIQVVKDHATCDLRDKLVPRIKVNDQQQVQEVIVFLGDIREGLAPQPPAEKPVIDQKACTFVPHVQVVIKDQPFEIVNSDPVAHSAHLVQHRTTVYNRMQPQQNMRSQIALDDVGLATLKCDVHDWMRAYIYVLWHPYHAVTGEDGSFRLSDVPPGEYELVAWQERLGEFTQKVKVETGKVSTVEFDLTTD
jgi:hypothetical protein